MFRINLNRSSGASKSDPAKNQTQEKANSLNFAALVYSPQSPPIALNPPQYSLLQLQKLQPNQFKALELVQLTLPANISQSLNFPLEITGRLELSSQGHHRVLINNNLIAHKGVWIDMPHNSLEFGLNRADQPMVKVQAAYGKINIKAKSLNLVKAQFFDALGMHFEVSQNPISIGDSIESTMQSVIQYDKYIGGSNTFFSRSTGADLDWTLPCKRSNGTYLNTKGSLSMVSPDGVVINHAEIYIRGGDWNLSSKKQVENLGGLIFVRGDVNFAGVHLKNNMVLGYSNFGTNGNLCSIIHPATQPGKITVNGKLITEHLDNYGGFIHVERELNARSVSEKNFEYKMVLRQGEFIIDASILQPQFTSKISSAKEIDVWDAQDPQIEGLMQSPLLELHYSGSASLGSKGNYRRPAVKAFSPMETFIIDYSALYLPKQLINAPWIHQPTIPLDWTDALPPAVVLGNGRLELLTPKQRFLYHPIQEIESLPYNLSRQLGRGHLDEEHSNSRELYIKGRKAAYALYLKYFAPKLIENGSKLAPELTQHVVRNEKTLAELSAEELNAIKFMVVYKAHQFEGEVGPETVYEPVSWVSPQYDNPKLRHTDGGLFADRLYLIGAPGSTFHSTATIHGEKELTFRAPHFINDRQSYVWWSHHYNTTKKKRFIGCSESQEVVHIRHSESQSTTGIVSTGPQGQANIQVNLFENINGAEISVGQQGLRVDIPKLIVGPGVNTSVGYSESRAGRNSATRYYSVPTIIPATIASQGGISGTLGELQFQASTMIAYDKDIDLEIKGDASLLTKKQTQRLGAVVSKNRWAVTVSEASTEIDMPSSFIALNGKVKLRIGGSFTAQAPQFLANSVDISARDSNVTIERLNTQVSSKTTGLVALTTYVNQSVYMNQQSALYPTFITKDGTQITTTNGDAIVEAPLISSSFTQTANGGNSYLDSALLHQSVDTRTTSYSLSNPVLAFADSIHHSDFQSLLSTVHNQFPLLNTVKELTRAKNTAAIAQGAVKTLYQSHQFLSELQSAGSFAGLLQNRMTRVGVGVSESSSNSQSDYAAVPRIVTQSKVTLIAPDGEAKAVGLSGTLSDLEMRGRHVTVKAPIEEYESFAETDGWDLSLGINSRNISISMGYHQQQSTEKYRHHAHQHLQVIGKTTLLGEDEVVIETPFTTGYSQIEGRVIRLRTVQDYKTNSSSNEHCGLGISFGVNGFTLSGSISMGMADAFYQGSDYSTVITSTQGSVVKAREKVIIEGAALVAHGPSTYSSPLTEVSDVTDYDMSESSRLGFEFTGGGSIPGFAEVGLDSSAKSRRHKATIGRQYTIIGSAGHANRDETHLMEESPHQVSHVWFGSPLITDAAQAMQEMKAGMDIIGNFWPQTPMEPSTEIVYKSKNDQVFIKEPKKTHARTNRPTVEKAVDSTSVPIKPEVILAEEYMDIVQDPLLFRQARNSSMLFFDVARDKRNTSVRNEISIDDHKNSDHGHGLIYELLHSTSTVTTIAHMSGVHLSGAPKLIGQMCEIGCEVIHTPSTNITEKLVCGVGIGFIKESINTAVATKSAIIAGVGSSVATTPVGGTAIALAVGASAYKLTDKLITPLADIAHQECHKFFAQSGSPSKNNAMTPAGVAKAQCK